MVSKDAPGDYEWFQASLFVLVELNGFDARNGLRLNLNWEAGSWRPMHMPHSQHAKDLSGSLERSILVECLIQILELMAIRKITTRSF